MLRTWLNNWAEVYLDELYRLHSPPSISSKCHCQGPDPPVFTCCDCLTSRRVCRQCILSTHTWIPTHRIEEWRSGSWVRTTLRSIHHVLPLGDHSERCPQGDLKSFTLGDVNGLHEIDLVFCGCPAAADPAIQLLRSRIYPCSEAYPASGFTFALLRQFHLASTEAKVPTKAFYMVMQRQTHNSHPRVESDRYRELLRISRAWMYLSDHKRSGVPGFQILLPLDVSLPCPACPRLNVNYYISDVPLDQSFLFSVHISYDGSFHLVRKNKSSDEHDICLSDGTKYFVEQSAYRKHLEANSNGSNPQSSQVSQQSTQLPSPAARR
ncbi:hypothetical protein BDV93DRAFT_459308 [Ceratobasidium sp. AG-I]|nr:hypothetical protein BDV93DRAFT_459308 [Ceratobasidium sp. AG-I]